MSSKFGWSLPAGTTTLPDEEAEGELLICSECGEKVAVISTSRIEHWEDWIEAPESDSDPFIPEIGPFRGEGEEREALIMMGINVYYKCECGFEVKDPYA